MLDTQYRISPYTVVETIRIPYWHAVISVYFSILSYIFRALSRARCCRSRENTHGTAVSCPPPLLSQGHRYQLSGMSSIQVTVPIVFWGRRPPSHEICSICKPDSRSGMATGCKSGQICIWDLHKRHTTGETVVRLTV